MRDLARAIARVVARGNCSGCGACVLLDSNVQMRLDRDGFNRPVVGSISAARPNALSTFEAICPGVRIDAPPAGERSHPIFGSYVDVWLGWATDPEVRHAGGSGGALTALATWMLKSGRVDSVVGSTAGPDPTRSVPVVIRTRRDALASAGSRYAPVSNLVAHERGNHHQAIVGKPCEVASVSALSRVERPDGGRRPTLLSFFCAGVPSQHATDELVSQLGVPRGAATSLRYRGAGWPGRFTVTGPGETSASVTYRESWGDHLGRHLQWRCRICVDGTGAHADIVAADHWMVDAAGYPTFEEAEGRSLLVARTPHGRDLLLSAERAGAIILEPADLRDVERTQPSQVARRRTLAGRLAGRWLVLKPPPRYVGFRILTLARSAIRANIRAVAGTVRRSLR